MNEQQAQIGRVSSQIASHVTKFLHSHIDKEFHVESLRRYVFDHVDGYVAPASPDRILRDLRQRGVVNYEVISRHKSLYKALAVEEQGELFK